MLPLVTIYQRQENDKKNVICNIICQLKRNSALIDAIICQGRTLVSLPEDPLSREIPLLENVTFSSFFFFFTCEESCSDDKMLKGFEITMKV